MLGIDAVRTTVEATLPSKYDRLLLTFYGKDARPKGDLFVIGDDYGTTLYLDPRLGHIHSIDDDGQLPTRFINSSIDQLARCLDEYDRLVRGPKIVTDEENIQMARAFRSRLEAIDPAACAEPDNWWATIIEQQEAGLL